MLKQFPTHHMDRLIGIDSKLDAFTLDRSDDHYDLIANPDSLSDFSSKNQHELLLNSLSDLKHVSKIDIQNSLQPHPSVTQASRHSRK